MNFFEQRRTRKTPEQLRQEQAAVRRQIAIAVSLAERKAKQRAEKEMLDYLEEVLGDNKPRVVDA